MNYIRFTYKKLKSILFKSIFLFLFPVILLFAQDRGDHKHHTMKDSTLMHRQNMIHSRSPMVMPFDMSKVTHYFIKTENGGVLEIKSKDVNDKTQISLIRKHLEKERVLFSNADFRDPKTLHGKNMPGLKILSESGKKYKVGYKELPAGASLTFVSKDSTVVNAIHKWFDAQLKDHGKDAKSHEDTR